MALLFMESFDGYGGTGSQATKWVGGLSGLGTSSPPPRTGAYRCTINSDQRRVINPATSTLIIGLAYYWDGTATGRYTIWSGTGFSTDFQCSVTFDSDGRIRVRNGASNGTALGTTTNPVLVASSYNFIEAKILVSNSGTFIVKCNGLEVINGSGDTQNQSASTIAGFSFNPGNSAGPAVDDLFVLDSSGSALNDFIGDCRVECLTPQAGNGSNTGLTCSTGTDHGALVDELPANDDTDYNFSATVGAKDTYAFTNVATVGSVKAVQVSARARKTDSATKELAVVTRVGSTDYDGATQAVASTSYSQYQQIWEKRPSDNADWTIADVNAAEFGLKVVT
jgi:hypothetical protein